VPLSAADERVDFVDALLLFGHFAAIVNLALRAFLNERIFGDALIYLFLIKLKTQSHAHNVIHKL
jgi:hypothetical protein